VHVVPSSPGIAYQIFNPDKSFLLSLVSPDKDYRGQLPASGDYAIEIINRGDGSGSYTASMTID
jgi:hypothetical protein